MARTVAMLRAAADLDAWQDGNGLVVRVTNWSGHKLPSGYPEGRRMWVNVEFTDDLGQTVAEHGHYDGVTAELSAGDTRVWETKLGISEDLAAVLGHPAGEGFHFAVNNVRVFDNRIPPLGFTNAAFEAIQSEPVGHVYADGQHWDDVTFAIPAGATGVAVELYYQSVSLEYATFLHTENHTDSTGVEFWNQYLATGMSPPVEMGSVAIPVSVTFCLADVNGDGFLDNGDILAFISAFLAGDLAADFNGDGLLDNGDIGAFISAFLAGC